MEYREDEYLMISGIQHFEFCRRQWALIHIEQQWNDNYLTVAGELVHDRAHDKDLTEKRGNTIQLLSEKSSPIRTVAPFVGAWIEITDRVTIDGKQRVAPFVGAQMIIFDDGFSKETSIFRAILLSTGESVCLIISQKEDNVSLSYVLGNLARCHLSDLMRENHSEMVHTC